MSFACRKIETQGQSNGCGLGGWGGGVHQRVMSSFLKTGNESGRTNNRQGWRDVGRVKEVLQEQKKKKKKKVEIKSNKRAE